jgi:sterol desaturase/sphingolipid hydroxylase (fatty acid hydroxylase superfamily)
MYIILEYKMIAILPLLTYFTSVLSYSKVHYGPEPDKEKVWISTRSQLLAFGANLYLQRYFDGYSFRLSFILLGMLAIDLQQYLSHRTFHNKWLYNHFHRYHHSQTPIHPATSFYNEDFEPAIDGVMIFLCLYLIQLSYLEYFIVTSLAVWATVSDHTIIKGKLSFHNIHHSVSKHRNLEQPFFDIFDRLGGTYFKSPVKLPFIP